MYNNITTLIIIIIIIMRMKRCYTINIHIYCSRRVEIGEKSVLLLRKPKEQQKKNKSVESAAVLKFDKSLLRGSMVIFSSYFL